MIGASHDWCPLIKACTFGTGFAGYVSGDPPPPGDFYCNFDINVVKYACETN